MKFREIKLPNTIHCAIPAALLATCLVILAVVILPDREPPLLPPLVTDGNGNLSSCDIFRGEWVPDPAGAPRYTTETCPVIHGHYDCARYGRPDLGFVRWRWRPAGCELPRLDAARFLRAARGKSMAFVGDSLARNQMHSLVCLLARAERPSPWTNATRHMYRYERHGFTVASFWSPFLVRAVETDPDGPARSGAGLWSLHLDEPDAGWSAHAGAFDYVVVSAGSWFFRPSVFHEHGRLVGCNGCLAPNVTDLTLRYPLRKAFRTALRAAAVGGARRRDRTVVVRTISPSHYENGTWNEDGDCARTRPLSRGGWKMNSVEEEMYAIQAEEFAAARREGNGARMLLLDATEAMALRPDAHPSKYRLWQPDRFNVSRDCLHWCLPGAMDACNDMLLHMLLHH
ncbi:Protein trichome birefringence-like 19 [Dichanthelium oligosanthes]|uniref:Protein trichome birefringence-like 19 n=1 Tax=Dichanthelium oligosanthes TaxID=888268 RepID=A0A1E5UY09_9POAL|nr:Protein trichome birefringence-like 19 [Dichanthelium oligosanthes]